MAIFFLTYPFPFKGKLLRSDATQILLVITLPVCDEFYSVLQARDNLLDKGVHLFVIGKYVKQIILRIDTFR